MADAFHTLVIGYGSPIRGDDAIGPLAAEALSALPLPTGVEVLARHVLTAELVPDLAAARCVIFLDACIDGRPGEVSVQALAPQAALASTMAHFHDPRELLAWCVVLYGQAPQAWLVSAAGASFDYAHCELSSCAQAGLAEMVNTVLSMLQGPDCRFHQASWPVETASSLGGVRAPPLPDAYESGCRTSSREGCR